MRVLADWRSVRIQVMNCEECKDLLGVFMDNEIGADQASDVRMHLAFCTECAHVCEDLTSILDVCRSDSPAEIVPPNSQALWCRINNIIESEIKPVPVPVEESRGRFWRLSFVQLAGAVILIAVISSVVTVLAVRRYTQPPADDFTARSAATQTTFEKLLGRVGLTETPTQARLRQAKEREAAIDYWNARVQARRIQWDRTTREAFDRNLRVIEESVNDYTAILQQDPEDDLSGEMLDSVLNDKVNLLRDFSDL